LPAQSSFDRSGGFDRTGGSDRAGRADQTGGFDRTGGIDQTGGFDRTGRADQPGGFDRSGRPDQTGGFDRAGGFDRSGTFDQRNDFDQQPGSGPNVGFGQAGPGSRTAFDRLGGPGPRTAFDQPAGQRTAFGQQPGPQTAFGQQPGSQTAFGQPGSRTAFDRGMPDPRSGGPRPMGRPDDFDREDSGRWSREPGMSDTDWRRRSAQPQSAPPGPGGPRYPSQRGGAPTITRTVDPRRDGLTQAAPEKPKRHVGRTIALMAVVVLVLGGGAYGFERWHQSHAASSSPSVAPSLPPLPAGDPITSQKTDPAPLTTNEVFGTSSIPSTTGDAGYTMVASQVVECANIATGTIATLLNGLGCTQGVRATLTTPDHAYVITAGIVNLPDATSADKARTSLKSLVSAGSGRFISLSATGVPVVSQVTTHLGWDSRGHFLTYAVIALADGKPISTDDKQTATIINDVVEHYLGGTVIAAREKQK
jgi:hypothetical protein